ncbi:MAG: hypothetical protein GDA49_06585 [Rhodospirillales bacterium]|nr:hypothetical protein [Rhodospirillales bacterium]
MPSCARRTAHSAAVRAALDAHRPEDAFDGKELALLRYAAKLTTDVGAMMSVRWRRLMPPP